MEWPGVSGEDEEGVERRVEEGVAGIRETGRQTG